MILSSKVSAAPAHLGWRLIALAYDVLPLLAIWFVASALILAFSGGTAVRPGSAAAWLELFALWAITGAYSVLSWRYGGQTLGMRPWRLRVVSDRGDAALLSCLVLRYLAATLSLLCLGIGFLWSLIDREQLALHDRASKTRLVRLERE